MTEQIMRKELKKKKRKKERKKKMRVGLGTGICFNNPSRVMEIRTS
jgi:hypothetical protein